jgi:uncharacterized membrane protein
VAFDLETHEGTSRLEAFSDGVFAIAATLLVVEIKPPRGAPDAAQLVHALVVQWPVYLSYITSFVYIGIYWFHHHNVYRYFRRTDPIFVNLNVLLLMMIALLPFPTALLGEYLRAHDERQRVVTLIYTGSLCVTGCLFLAVWLYATHRRRLIDRELSADFIQATTGRYLVGPIGYGLSFLVAWWSPPAGLTITQLTTLFYLLPFQVRTS